MFGKREMQGEIDHLRSRITKLEKAIAGDTPTNLRDRLDSQCSRLARLERRTDILFHEPRSIIALPQTYHPTSREVLDWVLAHSRAFTACTTLKCGCSVPAFDFCPDKAAILRWLVKWLVSHPENCPRKPRQITVVFDELAFVQHGVVITPKQTQTKFSVGTRVRVSSKDGRASWQGNIIERPANCREFGIRGSEAGPLVWLVSDHGRVYGIYPANVRRAKW